MLMAETCARKRIAAPVTALLLVLTLASSASAECAWVLWQNLETITQREGSRIQWERSPFLPESAYSSRVECAKALGAIAENWSEDPKVGDSRNAYRCLPDTVDPRGPKGSER